MNELIANKIEELLMNVIKNMNAELLPEKQMEVSLDTVLLGRDGKLDSLGLVRFIIAAELQVSEGLGKPLNLMDEKAFSLSQSPFRTVRTLMEFIVLELKNAG